MDHELTLPMGTLRLSVSAASAVGNVRKVNEDSFLARSPLFLVADGMGGHSFGDRASQSVVATFSAAVEEGVPPTPELVVQTIHRANHTVVAMTAGDDESVSGTTLAGVALVAVADKSAHHWMAFNVGDSRVYSWNGRRLEQVTVDHSAVQELLDLGHISALEAADHPHRNVVTRAMGVHTAVDPDVWLLPVGGRQLFLTCSDGLTKELGDDMIERILTDPTPLLDGQSLSGRLVDAAVAAGGRDNVTVVIVESELVGTTGVDEDTDDSRPADRLEHTSP